MKKIMEALIKGIVSIVICVAIVVLTWLVLNCIWNAFNEPKITPKITSIECDICGEELSWDKVTVQLDYHLYRFCPKCYEENKIGTSIKWNIQWARKDLERRIKEKSRPYKAKVIIKLIDEY